MRKTSLSSLPLSSSLLLFCFYSGFWVPQGFSEPFVSRVVVIFRKSKHLNKKVNLQRHMMDFLARQVCNTAILWEMLLAFPQICLVPFLKWNLWWAVGMHTESWHRAAFHRSLVLRCFPADQVRGGKSQMSPSEWRMAPGFAVNRNPIIIALYLS